MITRLFLGAAFACAAAIPLPSAADVTRAVSEMRASHPTSANWGSTHEGWGAASLTYNRDEGRIIELVMTISGVAPDTLASAGPGGVLGPIHIHNYPQGGPDFFVQQMPGEIEATEDGFIYRVSNWTMEPAMVGPDHVDVDFVLSEIAAGNAYFGLHTTDAFCPGNKKEGVAGTCAAPGTALSGHITVLPAPDPNVLALVTR